MERFEFVSNLGEGAYGTVWKCLDKETGEMVAMKRFKEAHLDEEVMHLALREIRLLKACVHPNVVALNEAFKSKSGRVYMVMEHVDRTLTEDLRKHPRGFQPVQAKLVAWQLLHATAFLHANKIIHRDLKPANILLSADMTVKLCDFGFARTLVPEDIADYTQYVVTRWYRPPEILVGAPYGSSVDVWAIGCLLCEMITGRPLFPGQDTVDQLFLTMRTLGPLSPDQMARIAADSHLRAVSLPSETQQRPLLKRYPELTADVMEVLNACLHPDPAQRLSALEVAALPYFDDVYDYVSGTPLQAACDEAYANAANNGSPLVDCLYQRASDAIRARALTADTARAAASGGSGDSQSEDENAAALGTHGFRVDGTGAAMHYDAAGRGRRFSSVATRPGGAAGAAVRAIGGIGARSMGAPAAIANARRAICHEGSLMLDQPEQSGLVSAGTALSKASADAQKAAIDCVPQAPTNIKHHFSASQVAVHAPGPLPTQRSISSSSHAIHAAAAAAAAFAAASSGFQAASSGLQAASSGALAAASQLPSAGWVTTSPGAGGLPSIRAAALRRDEGSCRARAGSCTETHAGAATGAPGVSASPLGERRGGLGNSPQSGGWVGPASDPSAGTMMEAGIMRSAPTASARGRGESVGDVAPVRPASGRRISFSLTAKPTRMDAMAGVGSRSESTNGHLDPAAEHGTHGCAVTAHVAAMPGRRASHSDGHEFSNAAHHNRGGALPSGASDGGGLPGIQGSSTSQPQLGGALTGLRRLSSMKAPMRSSMKQGSMSGLLPAGIAAGANPHVPHSIEYTGGTVASPGEHVKQQPLLPSRTTPRAPAAHRVVFQTDGA
ncbi:hypothetical protein FOA52_005388 [Chlamydomonas sp. UWO 241]|nr:hypothetical protein FOA52_005388 [Chlamydomonas sp. UWO 241]